MSLLNFIEHSTLLSLASILGYVLWQQHQARLKKLWDAARIAARIPRKWRPKSPDDCPACKSGISLTVQPIRRDVPAWSTRKQSTRGRKKLIKTQGHACLNPDCLYFGVTEDRFHDGKRGKYRHIQTFRCQACQRSFSSRRNTPLYHLKTHPGRVEMCLWLLAEGVDIAVLVRFTGHVDATLTRWLMRAGLHSEYLHTLLLVHLTLPYLQVDELFARLTNSLRLWLATSARPSCGWPLSR